MKRQLRAAVLVLGSTLLLTACGDGIDWSDPQNKLCQSGHYEADYDTKTVYKYERRYDSVKKKYVQKRVKNGTTKVYDGQDWVCDVRKAS